MFIAATTGKIRNDLSFQLAEEGIWKLSSINITEYQAAIKKIEMVSFETTQMALLVFVLNKISQEQKYKRIIIPLSC